MNSFQMLENWASSNTSFGKSGLIAVSSISWLSPSPDSTFPWRLPLIEKELLRFLVLPSVFAFTAAGLGVFSAGVGTGLGLGAVGLLNSAGFSATLEVTGLGAGVTGAGACLGAFTCSGEAFFFRALPEPIVQVVANWVLPVVVHYYCPYTLHQCHSIVLGRATRVRHQ